MNNLKTKKKLKMVFKKKFIKNQQFFQNKNDKYF